MDRSDVLHVERDQTCRFQRKTAPPLRSPRGVACEHAFRQIEAARELQHLGCGEIEDFIIDGQAYGGAIGADKHALAGVGKTVGALTVGNRPRFVEAVQIGTRLFHRLSLVPRMPRYPLESANIVSACPVYA